MKSLLVLLTAGLLLFFFYSTDLKLAPESGAKKEGYVKTKTGTLMGKATEDQYFKNLEAGQALSSPFRLVTGINSEATLVFGDEFLVAANSSIELLKKAGRYEVQLIAGKIKRLGSSPVVDFYSKNKKTDAMEIAAESALSISQLDPASLPSTSQTSLKKFDPTFQKRLQETFKLHQRFIEKCFIKHYERVKGQTQTGQVLVQFEVLKKGKIKNIEVVGSDYKDKDFHKCLIEVVSRIQLKYFESKSMTVNFPIQLQLPH